MYQVPEKSNILHIYQVFQYTIVISHLPSEAPEKVNKKFQHFKNEQKSASLHGKDIPLAAKVCTIFEKLFTLFMSLRSLVEEDINQGLRLLRE